MIRCQTPGSRVAAVAGLVGLIGALAAGQAAGQKNAPQQAERGGRRSGRDWRQGYQERIKQSLEVTEERWQTLQPMIEKAQTLARQTRAARVGFRLRRSGAPEGGESDQPQTDMEKSVKELQTALGNKDAKPEEIQAKLELMREARKKAQEKHLEAQDELRKAVTPRQEAQLVLLGVLD